MIWCKTIDTWWDCWWLSGIRRSSYGHRDGCIISKSISHWQRLVPLQIQRFLWILINDYSVIRIVNIDCSWMFMLLIISLMLLQVGSNSCFVLLFCQSGTLRFIIYGYSQHPTLSFIFKNGILTFKVVTENWVRQWMKLSVFTLILSFSNLHTQERPIFTDTRRGLCLCSSIGHEIMIRLLFDFFQMRLCIYLYTT